MNGLDGFYDAMDKQERNLACAIELGIRARSCPRFNVTGFIEIFNPLGLFGVLCMVIDMDLFKIFYMLTFSYASTIC
ncbi:hypothetical protein STEG23_037662 [Scotinomys teguina]